MSPSSRFARRRMRSRSMAGATVPSVTGATTATAIAINATKPSTVIDAGNQRPKPPVTASGPVSPTRRAAVSWTAPTKVNSGRTRSWRTANPTTPYTNATGMIVTAITTAVRHRWGGVGASNSELDRRRSATTPSATTASSMSSPFSTCVNAETASSTTAVRYARRRCRTMPRLRRISATPSRAVAPRAR